MITGTTPTHLSQGELTSRERGDLLRTALPACQPQEGSPANTFTQSELDDLKRALPQMRIGYKPTEDQDLCKPRVQTNKLDICTLQWESLESKADSTSKAANAKETSEGRDQPKTETPTSLDWYGAPRFAGDVYLPRAFREEVRSGKFTGPTNGVCPGFLQCNLVLVVLPQGQHAFDFLLFCQRNPKACPLIEVCDVGSACPTAVAPGADLRTDVPRYAIYRNGKLEKEVTDVVEYWPEQSVAFLIGCSFSYDGELLNAGIPLRSAEQRKNVPMYKTSLKCRPAGSLRGNMVVSMKPIPALQASKHVEITSKYSHAHGGPVSIGCAASIGVEDLNHPEWGDSVDVEVGDVPIFHACGVTPQNVLMESKVPYAITHSAGHMFVTDMPSDMGV